VYEKKGEAAGRGVVVGGWRKKKKQELRVTPGIFRKSGF